MAKEKKAEKSSIGKKIGIFFTFLLLIGAIAAAVFAYISDKDDFKTSKKKKTTTSSVEYYPDFSELHTLDHIKKYADENGLTVEPLYVTDCLKNEEGHLMNRGAGFFAIKRDGNMISNLNAEVEKGDIIIPNICKPATTTTTTTTTAITTTSTTTGTTTSTTVAANE